MVVPSVPIQRLFKSSIPLLLIGLVASCSVFNTSDRETSLASGIPKDYLTESAVCDAACVTLRENLEIEHIARLRVKNTVQGAIIGAAVGCGVVAALGESQDCAQGVVAGAIVGGAVGNGRGSRVAKERAAALRKARVVAAALQVETQKVSRARTSLRQLARKRQTPSRGETNMSKEEALAYRTDLLIAAHSLQELKKTLQSVRKYRDAQKENRVGSAALDTATRSYAVELSAFQDDFLTERERYKSILIAGNCLSISDQTDEEEYTPIPLPGCNPGRA